MKLFMTSFDRDFARGLQILHVASPALGRIAASLGVPVGNPQVPTAQVSWEPRDKRILFEINPSFIASLSDTEVAAVIAHETEHVLREHLSEIMDRKAFPRPEILRDAQECIINDGLFASTGLALPKGMGIYYGTERYNHDFSGFTSPQGYAFILSQLQEQEEQEDTEGESSQESGPTQKSQEGAGGGAGSSSGEQEEQDTTSQGSSPEQEEEAEEKEETSSGSGASEEEKEEDASSEGGDSQHEPHGGCQGVQVSEEDFKDFQKAVKEAVANAVNSMGMDELKKMPDSLKDLVDGLVVLDSQAWGLSDQSYFQGASVINSMNMNWFLLLEKINPKIRDFGKKKVKETWQRPPRRMQIIYPKVILPSRLPEEKDNKNRGDSLPTFIVALDLSGSIPRSLVSKLLSLVDDVPEKLIKALPATWSDDILPYDRESKRIVGPGGTNIHAVYSYAKKVEKETGKAPYVLVITDGQCSFGAYGYRTYTVEKEEILKKWYWCAIREQDVQAITRNFANSGYTTPERIFTLSDFTS